MSPLPGWMNNDRRVIRAMDNPMDKTTIVSIFPKRIEEVKVTIEPGRFVIEPGTYEKPSVLVIGSSSWWRDVNPDEPLLEIPQSSISVADAIVKDYCNGLLGFNMGNAMPGIFYIPGKKSSVEVIKENKPQLDVALLKQKNWYNALITISDVLWARTNGNPRSISDDARLAAQELQLKDKPWLKDFTTLELRNCPACGALRNDQYPVCQTCKTIIDKDAYVKAGFKAAV